MRVLLNANFSRAFNQSPQEPPLSIENTTTEAFHLAHTIYRRQAADSKKARARKAASSSVIVNILRSSGHIHAYPSSVPLITFIERERERGVIAVQSPPSRRAHRLYIFIALGSTRRAALLSRSLSFSALVIFFSFYLRSNF